MSRIVGAVPPITLAAIRTQLSYRVPGYYFSKEYRAGVWDGRKHLITEKGMRFATGLVTRVIEVCAALGIECEIHDRRTLTAPSQFMPLAPEATLREYQQRAVSVATTTGCGRLRIATGGGKTRVGAAIIASLERPAIFLVHTRDLLHQALDDLKAVMIYHELIGQVGDGVYAPNVITVATVQSICAALGIHAEAPDDEVTDDYEETPAAAAREAILAMLEACEVIIVDECHHVPAATIYEVLTKRVTRAIYRIGLSATDWRDDGADLMIEAALGPQLIDIDLSYLVENKFLVPAHITMRPMAIDEDAEEPKESWASIYGTFYTKNHAFHRQVVDINRTWYNEGRTILTLVTTVKQGRTLERLHNEMGVPSIFVCGEDTMTKRRQVIDDVRAKRLRSVIATSIADEGLNLPALDALNLAGGGKSSTRAYQRIGRTMRPYDGKTYSVVADYVCHGHEWLEKHSRARASIYRREHGAFKLTEIA